MLATATIFALGTLFGALGTATERHIMNSRTSRIRRALFGTRRRKVASVVAMLALTTGVALAAWLVSQAGSGGGKIGALTPLTVTASPSSDACYPGGTCDAVVHLNNPNGALTLVSSGFGGSPAPTGFGGGCSESNVTVPTQTISVAVPANADSDFVIPDAFALSANAPDSCQGITFTRSILLSASTG